MPSPALRHFLLPLLLTGCGSYYIDDLACEHDPFDWYDDPVSNLLHVEDEAGEFVYDPKGAIVQKRKGSYDFERGSFLWTDTFQANYWLKERRITGYGTVFPNGDLDLLHKSVLIDYLGHPTATQVRTKREGCKSSIVSNETTVSAAIDASPPPWAAQTFGTRRIVSDKLVEGYSETWYEDSGYMWKQEFKYTPKLEQETKWDYAEGGYVGVRWDYYDGTAWADWVQWGAILGDSYDLDGSSEYYFDGSHLESWDAYALGTTEIRYSFSIHYLYDGSGSGAYWEPSGMTCSVTVQAGGGRCSMECSNGRRYSC
jgi:hypothetical protein